MILRNNAVDFTVRVSARAKTPMRRKNCGGEGFADDSDGHPNPALLPLYVRGRDDNLAAEILPKRGNWHAAYARPAKGDGGHDRRKFIVEARRRYANSAANSLSS